MESFKDRLIAVQDAMRNCAAQSAENATTLLGELHLIDQDLKRWASLAPDEIRNLLDTARRELAMAEILASGGLYRQAFAGLRTFLELSFAAIYFSVNEFERRRWQSDRTDFSWAKALDTETGVLSPIFVREFDSKLVNLAESYAARCRGIYRECSQFIHAKAVKNSQLPDTVEFDLELLTSWVEISKVSGEAVILLMLIRYGEKIESSEIYSDLVDNINEHFGTDSAVQEYLKGSHG